MRCCWTIPHMLTPFPLKTFVEHLPRTKPKTLTLHSLINPRRTLSTTTQSLKYPQFESLSSHQKDQISLYVDTLLEWNQKMNLTAVTERDQIMERHVEDSLAIIPSILESYSGHCGCSYSTLNVVDVGSGQGVPGVILAIACPGWEVTLLESMKKRCGFLEHAIKATDLPNVQVVHGRAESIGQSIDFREVFDVAVARAVAELRVLAEYCLPLVRVGGLFVAAKGHNPLQYTGMSTISCSVFFSLLNSMPLESHSPYGQRTAIICLKDRTTPRRYPREAGTPAKLPL
ncbi:Ribosomal RNA small subunit methyltransferase G-like protein [Drosera capensis]